MHSGKSCRVRAKPARSAPRGTTRLSLPLKGEGSLSGFCFPTEILRLRYRLSVFLSRRKKNSEKERPLRGLRRDRLTPPETPRRTGKPGAVTDRNVMHSGKSFCIRGKARSLSAPRHDSTVLFFGFCASRTVILPINYFQYASLLLFFSSKSLRD